MQMVRCDERGRLRDKSSSKRDRGVREAASTLGKGDELPGPKVPSARLYMQA